VWDGVYTEAQAARGGPQYQEACAACHGPELQGQGIAPALVGEGFVSTWHGRSLEELFTRTQTTMPLDNPGTLTSGAVREIVAFLLQANKFPAGQAELPARSELKDITIARQRP
jgi:mono/diheme cytochrome c family protein